MKKIISSGVGVLCVYLLGAFFEIRFDISQWAEGTRMVVAVFMPMGALFGLIASIIATGEQQ
jgi:hypothetical protein